MGFVPAITSAVRGVFTISGRAPRAEYWYFVLLTFVVQVFATAILNTINPLAEGVLGWGMNLLLFTVTVRRGHDSGRPTWLTAGLLILVLGLSFFLTQLPPESTDGTNAIWIIACLFGALGLSIYLLVLMVLPSNPGSNKYGPNPYAAPAPGSAPRP